MHVMKSINYDVTNLLYAFIYYLLTGNEAVKYLIIDKN